MEVGRQLYSTVALPPWKAGSGTHWVKAGWSPDPLAVIPGIFFVILNLA